jgi:hypothetical protein
VIAKRHGKSSTRHDIGLDDAIQDRVNASNGVRCEPSPSTPQSSIRPPRKKKNRFPSIEKEAVRISFLSLIFSGGRGRAKERTGDRRRQRQSPESYAYFFSSGFVVVGVAAGAAAGLFAAAPAPAPPAGAGVVSSELQPEKQTSASTKLESIAPTLIPNFTDALLRKSQDGKSRFELSIPDDTYFRAVRPKDFTGNDFTLL